MSVRAAGLGSARNGAMLGWKPYVYGASKRGPAAARVRVAVAGRLPPSCGRPAGWWAHRRHGEKPCEACREAHNAARRKGTPRGRPRRSQCGSDGGYRRHLSEGTPVCEDCRQAVNADNRARYATAPCRNCGYLRTAPGHMIACGSAA